ncbi:hypothetical protein GCM10009784_07850 [Arthrobacter parietis]|uniref:Helix-turn-helix domain-containing protein n=1 Tax=Arthrobacter parietis TaxID=271434 RepID=A0ABN3AQG4_9MICC
MQLREQHDPKATPAEIFLSRKEAANFLGRSPGTLANWARLRVGPPYYRPEGGNARYYRPDLAAFQTAMRAVREAS